MKNKYAMVTRADKNCEELIKITHPILQCYAKTWGCDFIILDESKDEDWMKTYEDRHYRILQVGDILDNYERAIVIDSDVIIMPGIPDPFKTVDEDKIGSIYEDKGSRQIPRRHVIMDIQRKFGDVGWREGYINSGVLIISKQHKRIFEKIEGEVWNGAGRDDALLGYNAHKYNFNIQELSFKWNHMSLFSEPWNNNANRFDSYIIHYAGAANFPDDPTDRKKGSNDLASRIELITSDIDRITAGLMVFRETHLTEKQGSGWSTVWTAIFGVQNREIILKVHKTRIGLEREVQAFQHGIPYLVDYMGVCEDPNVGKFVMMEKLKDLPEVISATLMQQIATNSLIAMRQLYKHNIPWICRLDHIMIDKDNKVKLIDFNDDSLPKVPFYGYEGQEAIMMDGVCDSEGLYIDRYNYPRSGWIAIMEYLCKKNNLDSTLIIDEAENCMIEYEYQALENVHQPIYFNEYKDILRRESDKNDPNFGKLVPANRGCVDRARIIHDSLDLDKQGCTWLDIGSNVGWFCFYFKDFYVTEMTGIDADKNMIEFAIMLAEGNRSNIVFETAEINSEYVNAMPCYDIISALSVLHWSLIDAPEGSSQINIGSGREYFIALLKAICKKVNNVFFFEFPPHAYGPLGVSDTEGLKALVRKVGQFKDVIQIGTSDANRPVLKCVKE